MNIVQELIDELKRESINTRKLLEAVPDGKNDWKPHEKSFPLGRLAGHVAELPTWIGLVVNKDVFDIGSDAFERLNPENKKELLAKFDEKLEEGLDTLVAMTPEQLEEDWTFKYGDHIIAKSSRYQNIRTWALNHQIHHRAQLGVYLRLLDIPITGTYGPSADDRGM